MNRLHKFSLITLAAALSACSTTAVEPPAEAAAAPVAATTLLVNLEDGTVIMQKIDVGADLCFKNNGDTATTCLTRGAAIVDPATNQVIAFEMIEDRIDLVAKSE